MKLISLSPEETEEIGLNIGKRLRPGSVVGLYGDLGAGKTTLVKGIASAFGIEKRDITSASFTIIAEYPSTPPFYHIDLYRLPKGGGLDEIGIWDYLGEDSVSVIEWAEKLGEDDIDNLIRITITDRGERGREVAVEGLDE